MPVYDVIRYFPRTILDLQNGGIAEAYFEAADPGRAPASRTIARSIEAIEWSCSV